MDQIIVGNGYEKRLSVHLVAVSKSRVKEENLRKAFSFFEYALQWCSLVSTFITSITILFCTGIQIHKDKIQIVQSFKRLKESQTR